MRFFIWLVLFFTFVNGPICYGQASGNSSSLLKLGSQQFVGFEFNNFGYYPQNFSNGKRYKLDDRNTFGWNYGIGFCVRKHQGHLRIHSNLNLAYKKGALLRGVDADQFSLFGRGTGIYQFYNKVYLNLDFYFDYKPLKNFPLYFSLGVKANMDLLNRNHFERENALGVKPYKSEIFKLKYHEALVNPTVSIGLEFQDYLYRFSLIRSDNSTGTKMQLELSMVKFFKWFEPTSFKKIPLRFK